MNRNGAFHFGLEAEFLLVDARTFEPLWHPQLRFDTLYKILESIPVDDFPCDGLDAEPLHRAAIPFIVEGYHLPDPDLNPIDMLPKGIEIRTPACASIEDCLAALRSLHLARQPAGEERRLRGGRAIYPFHCFRDILPFQGRTARQEHCLADHVFQFTHVPGPGLALE